MATLSFHAFELSAATGAEALEDRLHCFVSAPQEWTLYLEIAQPLIIRSLIGRFPWELDSAEQGREPSQ